MGCSVGWSCGTPPCCLHAHGLPAAIASAIERHPLLSELHLSGCRLTDKVAPCIGAILKVQHPRRMQGWVACATDGAAADTHVAAE